MESMTEAPYADQCVSFWRGCREIDKGCRNCFAKRKGEGNPMVYGTWGSEIEGGTRVVLPQRRWEECGTISRQAEAEGERARVLMHLADPFEDWQGPLVDWRGQRLSFCPRCDRDYYFAGRQCRECSRQSEDLLMWHVRDRMFRTIDATPWIDWLLVTKYPENVRMMWTDCEDWDESMDDISPGFRHNVWLGVSFHDQATADERIPALMQYEHLSPVLWGAAEPMLSPISLNDIPMDWIVIGAEGAGNRPCDVRWIMDLVDQADANRVPAWVTRIGSNAEMDGELYLWRESLKEFPRRVSPFGEEPHQWPAFVRRQELPHTLLF